MKKSEQQRIMALINKQMAILAELLSSLKKEELPWGCSYPNSSEGLTLDLLKRMDGLDRNQITCLIEVAEHMRLYQKKPLDYDDPDEFTSADS